MNRMSHPTRQSIALAGGSVSCLAWERDAPLLHFAHANGFNAETYRGLLSPLAEDFHIVASDARGHGFTALPTAPELAKGWSVYRDDLLALLDRIAPKGAILAGHSMGATASLMAAAIRPEAVKALVLIEPVLMPKSWQGGDNELAQRAAKRRDIFESAEEAFAVYRGRGAFKTWPDDTLRDYLKGGLKPAPGGGVRLCCDPAWEAQNFRLSPGGVSDLAGAIDCAVTLIHGNGAASHPELENFRALRPSARVVAEPRATHFLPMEFPELVREEILKLRNGGRDD